MIEVSKDKIVFWKAADGRTIPLIFLSDKHLNASIADLLEKHNKLCCAEKNPQLAKRQQELERSVSALGNEKLRRKKKSIVVDETLNPYYDPLVGIDRLGIENHGEKLHQRLLGLVGSRVYKEARDVIDVLHELGVEYGGISTSNAVL